MKGAEKNLMRKIWSAIAIVGLMAAASAAYGATTITLANNQWDSQMFHNEVAKIILEKGFDGYQVEFSTGSSILSWQAIINDDLDLLIECWKDNFATYAEDVAEERIVELGVLFDDSEQGLYVPRYLVEGDPARNIEALAPELKHVKDLEKYSHLFEDSEHPGKGRIYGSIPGWLADEVLNKKVQYYGLDDKYVYFRTGSEATLFTSLMRAYDLGEPWVGYCWKPAWVINKVDIILLEDAPFDQEGFQEGKTEFSKAAITNICSPSFIEKHPQLVPFLKKYRTNSALVSEALAHIEDTKENHTRTAVWFLKNNDKLLDEWLESEPARKVREALKSM